MNRTAQSTLPFEEVEYISLKEAARRYGVSYDTLRRRISEGKLPAVKGGYKLIRVLAKDVAKLFPPIPTVDPADYGQW